VCLITTTHFAAEAYPSNPGPALVLVVGTKNIVSFGMIRGRRSVIGDTATDYVVGASFGIVPMVHTWNYLTAYMVVSRQPASKIWLRCTKPLRQLFALFVGIYLLGIPIYFLNPKVSLVVTQLRTRVIANSLLSGGL
jgi:hypothetical protein